MILSPSRATLLKDETPQCFQDFFPHLFIAQCTNPWCEGAKRLRSCLSPESRPNAWVFGGAQCCRGEWVPVPSDRLWGTLGRAGCCLQSSRLCCRVCLLLVAFCDPGRDAGSVRREMPRAQREWHSLGTVGEVLEQDSSFSQGCQGKRLLRLPCGTNCQSFPTPQPTAGRVTGRTYKPLLRLGGCVSWLGLEAALNQE